MAEMAAGETAWGAGRAAAEDDAPKAAALGLLGARAAGCLKYAAGLALMVVVGSQVASMGFQAAREAEARPEIERMRAEQKWMAGEGLGSARRVGRLPPKGAGHSVDAHREVGAFSAPTLSVGGWDVSVGGHMLARAAESMGLGASWLDGGWAVSAALPSARRPKDAWGHGAEATYRHEEAHARMAERKVRAGAPSAWPSQVGRAVAAEIDARWALHWGRADAQRPGWRSEWLSGIHREAFADAFEVLSSARKGPGALGKAALATHAMRVFQAEGSASPSASTMAGSDHAVDMASYLAGQLDEGAVSRLEGSELDELARQIADRSVAWALARQAPTLGFFEGEGRSWWEAVGAARGVDVSDRQKLWDSWRSAAVSEAPAAVFGIFEARAGGVAFKAEGLPGWAARVEIASLDDPLAPKARALWRFDGMGGQVILSEAWDPRAAKASSNRLVFQLPGTLIEGDPEKLRDDVAGQRRANAARVGAVAAHAALCESLRAKGCLPETEARRVADGASEEAVGVAALDLARIRAGKARVAAAPRKGPGAKS